MYNVVRLHSITHVHFRPIEYPENPVEHSEADTKWAPFSRQHFQNILLNKHYGILMETQLKSVPQRPMYNITALVQIMERPQSGDQPLSEPMMA